MLNLHVSPHFSIVLLVHSIFLLLQVPHFRKNPLQPQRGHRRRRRAAGDIPSGGAGLRECQGGCWVAGWFLKQDMEIS